MYLPVETKNPAVMFRQEPFYLLLAMQVARP